MRRCLWFLLFIALGCAERTPQPPSVAKLTEMLQSGEAAVQLEAAQWVVSQGPKAADASAGLVTALKSPDVGVRTSAALALGSTAPANAETAVPALTAALTDPEKSVRHCAAEALGKFGPAAASAIPALERLATQPDRCASAPIALKKIRP